MDVSQVARDKIPKLRARFFPGKFKIMDESSTTSSPHGSRHGSVMTSQDDFIAAIHNKVICGHPSLWDNPL